MPLARAGGPHCTWMLLSEMTSTNIWLTSWGAEQTGYDILYYMYETTNIILYSRKLWQALNLANQSSECIGEFQIWRSRALPHSAMVYEIILAGFKFGNFLQNHQIKTSPKFPVIR